VKVGGCTVLPNYNYTIILYMIKQKVTKIRVSENAPFIMR
jgi:hypothetical protein